ncbi:hypothetical protein Tco_0550994 [Tanacetum coccineum]
MHDAPYRTVAYHSRIHGPLPKYLFGGVRSLHDTVECEALRKSTLTTLFVLARWFLLYQTCLLVTGDTGMPDTDHREAERVVTTKLSGQYVHYEMNEAAGKRGGECTVENAETLIH